MRKIFLTIAFFLAFSDFAYSKIANHLVISEIQIHGGDEGGGVDSDWVEIYNPTSNSIDVSDYSIQKMNKDGGSFYRKKLSGSIPSHGFFLIVRNGDDTPQILKDMSDVLASNSFSLSSDFTIFLVDNNEDVVRKDDENIVDFLGFGLARDFEGEVASLNPNEGGSIERRSNETHDETKGNAWDTNENFNDFFLQSIPNPQNSLSEIENPNEVIEEEDTTPPTTTSSPQGDYYNSTQSITFIKSEESTIHYAFGENPNEEDFVVYVDDEEIPINETTKLNFFAIDISNNKEEVKIENYTIDTTSPIFETFEVVEEGDGFVSLSWGEASDENFEGYFLKVNNSEEENLGSEILTITKEELTNDTTYIFTLIARDLASNETILEVNATPQGIQTFAIGENGEIFINEIAWMGNETSSNDEWIELKNTTSNKIFDLSGWVLKGEDEEEKPYIELSGLLYPNEFFLLERSDDYVGGLENSGEILVLLDSEGNEVDRVDGSNDWEIGGDNDSKKTLQRVGSEEFHTSFDVGGNPKAKNFNDKDLSVASITSSSTNPLPSEEVSFIAKIENRGLDSQNSFEIKWLVNDEEVDIEIINEELGRFGEIEKEFSRSFEEENTFEIKAILSLSEDEEDEDLSNNENFINLKVENHLLINEFIPNPKGNNDGESEWIEIFNSTSQTIDLSGWELNGVSLSGEILANEYKVVFASEEGWDSLSNSSGEVILRDCGENVVDSKTYENPIEGKSFGRNPNNLSEWLEFFHPTQGVENVESNSSPQAIITIQGSGNTSGSCSLYVNLSGEDSIDSDGDSLAYEWDFGNGETSDEANPSGFYFDVGNYVVSLVVEDVLGETHETSQNFSVSACSSGGGGGSWYAKDENEEEIISSISANRVVMLINEVSIDSESDWVEIYMKDDGNNGNGIDVGGFYFESDKRIKTIPQNTKLKSGEFLVLIFKSEEEDWNSSQNGVWKIFTTKSGLTKTDEGIILKDSSGVVEDALVWENRDGKWSRGEEEDVKSLVEAKAWISKNFEDAFDSSRIKREVVIARKVDSEDTNSREDWFLTPFATMGEVNRNPPTYAKDFKILFSEIYPKNVDGDRVKIVCLDCENEVDLSGFFLKTGVNDSIFDFPPNTKISKEKPIEIVFGSEEEKFKEGVFHTTFRGLVGSDCLLSLKDFENMSVDFVGWSDRKNPPNREWDLSMSEITQLEKRFRNGEWDGEIEVSLLDSKEIKMGGKIIRKNLEDTNSKDDWVIENLEGVEEILTTTSQNIRISEILPNPRGKDSSSEWFELVNVGEEEVNLYGWIVMVGSSFYEFEESVILIPHEFKAFASLLPIKNSGGEFSLLDFDGEMVDSLTYEAMEEGIAFAKDMKGEFHETSIPTPNEANGFFQILSSKEDGDGDGLSDEEEAIYQTNPQAFDSDGDGLGDAFEIHHNLNPNLEDSSRENIKEFRKELQTLASQNFEGKASEEEGIFLSGVGIPSGKMRIYIQSQLEIVEVSVNEEGRWSYVLDKELESGNHNIFTQLVSPNGIEGVASKAMSFTFNQDYTPPTFIETLRISEILPNPQGEDSSSEWIEVENFGEEEASLENYKISVGRKEFTFGNLKIPPQSFILLERKESGLTLPNVGGKVSLSLPTNRVISEVNYEKVGEEVSIAWDGKNFTQTKIPTPLASNQILLLPQTQKSKIPNIYTNGNLSNNIRISEILVNPKGNDAKGEFIEIENFGETLLNLGNWKLSDGEKIFTFSNIILKPKEFRSFPRSETKIALNNVGVEKITLSDFEGNLISSVEARNSLEGVSFAYDGEEFRESAIITPNSPNEFDSQTLKGVVRFVGENGFIMEVNREEIFVEFGGENEALLAKALFKEKGEWKVFVKHEGEKFILKSFDISPSLLRSKLLEIPKTSTSQKDFSFAWLVLVFALVLFLLRRFAKLEEVWESKN